MWITKGNFKKEETFLIINNNNRDNVMSWRKKFLQKRKSEVETFLNFLEERKTASNQFSNWDLIYLEKIYLSGHSFGCASTLFSFHQSLRNEKRIKALLLFDPWMMPVEDEVLNFDFNLPIVCLLSEPFANNKVIENEGKKKKRNDGLIY